MRPAAHTTVPTTAHAVRQLAHTGRAHAHSLLRDADEPHAELLSLVWGPRFDREHALSLWARWSARQPAMAAPVLPSLMRSADSFDALGEAAQQQLRRLILRHQRLVTQGSLAE